MNYDRLIADIRLDLDSPDQHQPSDDAVMLAVADISQLLDVKAQNTGEGWSVAYQDLPVSAGQPIYALSFPDFGKPVRIHTIEPGNRQYWTRKVEIVDRQDVENYYDGPVGGPVDPYGGGAGAERWKAACAVVYWTTGQPSIEFIPVPNTSCQYRIWYETGEIPEPSPGGSVPVQLPFHRYVRVRAALALLGKCHWSKLLGENAARMDPEKVMKMMADHAERQRGDLVPVEIEYRKAYEDYIATSQQSGTGYGNPYGGWSEDCWY